MNEPANPYLQPPSLENEEHQHVVILDSQGPIPISQMTTRVIVDPAGGRHVIVQQGMTRNSEGGIATPGEQLYECINGCKRQLLTAASMVRCNACFMPVCRACIRIADDGILAVQVCPKCYEQGRVLRAIKRNLRWLTNLS